MDLDPLLRSGLAELKLTLSESTQQNLLLYLALLARWNKVYNLTAVRDPAEMVSRHLLDSLAILPHINLQQPLLDVGSGAGLPGLVLAITQPNVPCVLLDSNQKKTRFLQQVALELKLDNVTVLHQRVEQYQPAQPFSQITARAYSELLQFYQQTRHLCAADGCLLAMKGVYPDTELVALATLPVRTEVIMLQIPHLVGARHLVKIFPNAV